MLGCEFPSVVLSGKNTSFKLELTVFEIPMFIFFIDASIMFVRVVL